MANFDLQEHLFKLSTNYFHKWYGLLSSFLLTWVILLGLYKLFPSNTWFKWYALGIIIVCLIIFIGWALYSFKYPKRSKKKLGVVIAVYIETKEDYKLFKKDFLSPFKEKITDHGLPFDVLVLNNHQSEKIDTAKDAGLILKKTKAHFIVWGQVKRRDHQSKEHYIFALRAMVIHSPISEVQKVLLTRDFDSLLKNKIMFETGLQYAVFDLRASELFSAVNYITGRAALLSGDPSTAITLHESLYNSLQKVVQTSVNLKNLEKLLSIEHSILADHIFLTNSQKVTSDFIKHIASAIKYDKSNYSALLKQSIVDFNGGSGDATKALKTLGLAKKCGKTKEWLYSKIFLHLWLEEYTRALAECDRINKKSKDKDSVVAEQICEFNKNIIESFPGKIQICFWSGFLFYFKMDNPTSADSMFQKLLDEATDKEALLVARAKDYLSKIKLRIGY